MIRQDKYEANYQMFRYFLDGDFETDLTELAQQHLRQHRKPEYYHAIARRAIRDEPASRFARESIQDVENYDD